MKKEINNEQFKNLSKDIINNTVKSFGWTRKDDYFIGVFDFNSMKNKHMVSPKTHKSIKSSWKKKYNMLKKSGICVRCYKPTNNNYVRCNKCLKLARQYKSDMKKK